MAKWRILLLFGTGWFAGFFLIWLGLGALLEHYSLALAAGLPASLPPIGGLVVAYSEIALGLILLVSLFLCRKAALPTKMHRKSPLHDWATIVMYSLMAFMWSSLGLSRVQSDPMFAAAYFVAIPNFLGLVFVSARGLLRGRKLHNPMNTNDPEHGKQDA